MQRFLVQFPDSTWVLAYVNSKADLKILGGSHAWYTEQTELTNEVAHLDRLYLNTPEGRARIVARAWKAKDTTRRRGDLVTLPVAQLRAISAALDLFDLPEHAQDRNLIAVARKVLNRRGIGAKARRK